MHMHLSRSGWGTDSNIQKGGPLLARRPMTTNLIPFEIEPPSTTTHPTLGNATHLKIPNAQEVRLEKNAL